MGGLAVSVYICCRYSRQKKAIDYDQRKVFCVLISVKYGACINPPRKGLQLVLS